MDQQRKTAVCVRNASKAFGTKVVLDNFNMHVEKGTIYGLLGSSGCGKTTLLSCIVGRKKLDSGSIWVLGGSPGSSESGIPGPRVGYMPQDVALVSEFTVKATLYYFGRLFYMSDSEIEKRFAYLTQLLDLPPADRAIANCSGGQQRRVSLAAALVNNPELLILDEPTVGLDPVLRESIWKFLFQITETHQSSVVITTHYIEEASQAHRLGMLRNGRLLAEEPPHILLNKFGTNSLEYVFIQLSLQETQVKLVTAEDSNAMAGTSSNTKITNQASSTKDGHEIGVTRESSTPKADQIRSKYDIVNAFDLNGHRLKALFGKSWFQVTRNYSGIAFMIIFPILQVSIFFMAVGDDPKNLKIATLNHENHFGVCGSYVQNDSATPLEEGGCKFQHLGCRFIKSLNTPMTDPVFYDDISKAKDSITHGDVTGALYIPENFSSALQDKMIDGNTDNQTLQDSQIQVWLDMSNRQVGGILKAKLIKIFIDFLKTVFSDCNYFVKFAAIPVNFKEIHGNLDDTFLVFMAPAIILTMIFFMGTWNASTIMITDRLEGIWDRSIVAGVSALEIVVVHFITQVLIMVLQSALILVSAFVMCKIEYIGTFFDISIIVLLQGVVGIALGFLISVMSTNHSMANLITTGSFYPMMVLCGMQWPLEGMPIVLRWIGTCMPCTLPIIAVRNIMKKGWSILHSQVVAGIWVPVVYVVVFLIISVLEVNRRR